MEITMTETGLLTAAISITLTSDDYMPEVEKQILEKKRHALIPGFRPGKAPIQLIKKYYGKDILQYELLNMAVEKVLQYIQDNQLEVIGHPLLNHEKTEAADTYDEQKTYVYSFDIGLKPQFIVDLSNFQFSYHSFPVTEADIENELKKIAAYHATYDNLDVYEQGRKLHIHGVVTFRRKQSQEEQTTEQETSTGNAHKHLVHINHAILAEHTDLEQLFIHKKTDDIIEIPIELLRNNDKIATILLKYAAKEIDEIAYVECAIKNILLEKTPEITDEFVQQHFEKQNIKTLEQLKQNIRENLEKHYQNISENIFWRDIKKTLLEQVTFDLPVDHLKRLIHANLKENTYQEQINYEAIFEEYRWDLISSKILQQFGQEITDETILEYLKQLQSDDNQTGQNEKIAEHYMQYLKENPKEKDKLVDYLTEQRLKEIVKNNCKIEYKQYDSFDQYLETIKQSNS